MVYMPLSKFYSLSLLVTREAQSPHSYANNIRSFPLFHYSSQRKTRLEFRLNE